MKKESIQRLVAHGSVMLDGHFTEVILEQALFFHGNALSHARNASFHGMRISAERKREKEKERKKERGNSVKFLDYSPSGLYVPSIPYSCANASESARMHARRAIHKPAKKTYELSSRLMEYARTRTMDPRDWTASPFNYLASYSISEARTRRHPQRGRSESAKRGSNLHRFLLLKASFYSLLHLARVIKKIEKIEFTHVDSEPNNKSCR